MYPEKLHTCSTNPRQPINERIFFFFRQMFGCYKKKLGLEEFQIAREKKKKNPSLTCRQGLMNTCAKIHSLSPKTAWTLPHSCGKRAFFYGVALELRPKF